MRRFVGYRPNPPESYREQGIANPPNEPQYEGVVFSDGTVVCRWLTAFQSHSVWANWDDFWHVHGHPEYDTRIEWLDVDSDAPLCVRIEEAGMIHDSCGGRILPRVLGTTRELLCNVCGAAGPREVMVLT